MVPSGAVIFRSRSLIRLRVRLFVAVWAAPAGSVQASVARMGLTPSQVKVLVRIWPVALIEFSISLGAAGATL